MCAALCLLAFSPWAYAASSVSVNGVLAEKVLVAISSGSAKAMAANTARSRLVSTLLPPGVPDHLAPQLLLRMANVMNDAQLALPLLGMNFLKRANMKLARLTG
jgi:hypothetical protein